MQKINWRPFPQERPPHEYKEYLVKVEMDGVWETTDKLMPDGEWRHWPYNVIAWAENPEGDD